MSHEPGVVLPFPSTAEQLNQATALLTGDWDPVEYASLDIHRFLIALAAGADHELAYYQEDAR